MKKCLNNSWNFMKIHETSWIFMKIKICPKHFQLGQPWLMLKWHKWGWCKFMKFHELSEGHFIGIFTRVDSIRCNHLGTSCSIHRKRNKKALLSMAKLYISMSPETLSLDDVVLWVVIWIHNHCFYEELVILLFKDICLYLITLNQKGTHLLMIWEGWFNSLGIHWKTTFWINFHFVGMLDIS